MACSLLFGKIVAGPPLTMGDKILRLNDLQLLGPVLTSQSKQKSIKSNKNDQSGSIFYLIFWIYILIGSLRPALSTLNFPRHNPTSLCLRHTISIPMTIFYSPMVYSRQEGRVGSKKLHQKQFPAGTIGNKFLSSQTELNQFQQNRWRNDYMRASRPWPTIRVKRWFLITSKFDMPPYHTKWYPNDWTNNLPITAKSLKNTIAY